MKLREKYISDLAEGIAEKYLVDGLTRPETIAKHEKILVQFMNFEYPVLGVINYENNYEDFPFCIVLNKNKHSNLEHFWTRSTLSHELGHYFIPNHKSQLKKGLSLSYDGKNNYSSDDKIEREAQLFATNLLMPKSRFSEKALTLTLGMEGIVHLANYYNTSISSTAYHYCRNNIIPCITVKWNSENKIQGKWISTPFQRIIPGSLYMKFNTQRPMTEVKKVAIPNSTLKYNKAITSLSAWVYSVSESSKRDIVLIEETLYLGAYGGITILFPASY